MLSIPAKGEDYAYTTNDGAITITRYIGPGGVVTVPSTINGLTVVGIGDSAFADAIINGEVFTNANMTSVNIPDSVTNMGKRVFLGCEKLVTVTLPKAISTIGQFDFSSCQHLANITIPDRVVSIEAWAFEFCSSLTNITLGNNVTNIGRYAFRNCTSLKSLIIPEGVTRIQEAAFQFCSGLSSVVIPNSVIQIGDSAFSSCSGLTNASIPESPATIGNFAFSRCSGLANVTIPNGVTSIGGFAFSYTSLTNIFIPSSVTNIPQSPFFGCANLQAITVDANNPAYTSIQGVLFDYNQKTLIECPTLKAGSYIIPPTVTSIGFSAFAECAGLTNICIPNNVTNMRSGAFSGCAGLTDIQVDAENLAYASVAGVLFDKSQATLLQYPSGKAASSYAIPNNVTSIGLNAFIGCAALTNVAVPESVSTIGSQAFALCTGLTSIVIPSGVTSLEGGLVAGCSSLSSVVMGKGVKSIGLDAFANCSKLTSIIIPSGVTSLGSGAFSGCSSLAGVYFEGDSPYCFRDLFTGGIAIVYYLPGTSGWSTSYLGRPTAQWTLPFPLILTSSPSLGVRSNQFGFTVSWATNRSVAVEVCTNLANPIWSSMGTTVLINGSFHFSDPQWSNNPAGVYRVRSQ